MRKSENLGEKVGQVKLEEKIWEKVKIEEKSENWEWRQQCCGPSSSLCICIIWQGLNKIFRFRFFCNYSPLGLPRSAFGSSECEPIGIPMCQVFHSHSDMFNNWWRVNSDVSSSRILATSFLFLEYCLQLFFSRILATTSQDFPTSSTTKHKKR